MQNAPFGTSDLPTDYSTNLRPVSTQGSKLLKLFSKKILAEKWKTIPLLIKPQDVQLGINNNSNNSSNNQCFIPNHNQFTNPLKGNKKMQLI